MTMLHAACVGGNEKIVEALTKENNAAVDFQLVPSGVSPLMTACAGGHERIVRLLLRKGADCEKRNSSGRSLMALAASARHGGNLKLLPMLLTRLEVDGAGTDGTTALVIACEQGKAQCVQYLLKQGADPTRRVSGTHAHNSTALHRAAHIGHTQVVRILLEDGRSSLCGTDGLGMTALHCAISLKLQSVIKVLCLGKLVGSKDDREIEVSQMLKTRDRIGRKPLDYLFSPSFETSVKGSAYVNHTVSQMLQGVLDLIATNSPQDFDIPDLHHLIRYIARLGNADDITILIAQFLIQQGSDAQQHPAECDHCLPNQVIGKGDRYICRICVYRDLCKTCKENLEGGHSDEAVATCCTYRHPFIRVPLPMPGKVTLDKLIDGLTLLKGGWTNTGTLSPRLKVAMAPPMPIEN